MDLPPGSDLSVSGGGSTEGKKRIFHTVKKGETLSSIGRKYRASVSDILAWNSSVKKDLLYPGDRLLIWIESD